MSSAVRFVTRRGIAGKCPQVQRVFARFPTFMSNIPIAVQNSSRSRTMSATNIPAEEVSASPEADIMKPPSRPPICSGMKNSRLANRLVNASIRTHCR